ncbi:hypothetical protein EC988_000605 [Linderina pennispora]|nr:hypothetical protein EC988_000605 [Linderina pennispora]
MSDRVENEQMLMLGHEIERLFAAYPGNPAGSDKDLASRVDLRILGDVRQLGRFVQAANTWCAATQALMASMGHVELVSKITQRRAANYQWHRRKWAERMGGKLGRVASDMDGSMEVEQRVFIAELIERDELEAASKLEAEAKMAEAESGSMSPVEKRYKTDSEEDRESSEENNDDDDDGDFRLNALARGGRRGKRRLRSTRAPSVGRPRKDSNAAPNGVKRTRRSRSGVRAMSHDSKESTPPPSALQKASRRSSAALPRGVFSSSLIANMTRSDMQAAVCEAIDIGDSDGAFTLDNLQALLREGDKLFFNSPELDTLLQLEKRALGAVSEIQQLSATSPDMLSHMDGVSRSPEAYGAEPTNGERLDRVRQRISDIRREIDQIGLEFAQAESLWQIEGQISWSSECQERFRKRTLTQSAMEGLLSEARRLGLDPSTVALYARLCDVQRSAVEWEEDAQRIIDSDSLLDLRDMGVLLEKGRNLEFLPPSYEQLRKLQQQALDIQARADRLVERMGADNITFRPEYADMVQFIESYTQFARFRPSSGDRLESELDRANEWWLRVQNAFANPSSEESASDRVRVLTDAFRRAADVVEGRQRMQDCVCLWPISDTMAHKCVRCGETYHDACLMQGDLRNLAVWGPGQSYICPLCSHRLQPQAWERHFPSLHRINRFIERARGLSIVMEDLDPLVGIVLHARTLVRIIGKDLANADAIAPGDSSHNELRQRLLRSHLRLLLGIECDLGQNLMMDLYGQLLGLSTDTYGSAVPPPRVHGSIGSVPESMAAVDGTSTPDVDESGGAEHPFQAQFDELAHLIASPPPASMDHGQGLLTAGQAFSQNTDNCVCAENGGELNSDPMAPVIQCDSCCDYYHPECVQLPIVDARIIRFHQLSRQAGVIVDIPEFVPRGPKSYMCPGCCVNSGMPYAYGEIEVVDD